MEFYLISILKHHHGYQLNAANIFCFYNDKFYCYNIYNIYYELYIIGYIFRTRRLSTNSYSFIKYFTVWGEDMEDQYLVDLPCSHKEPVMISNN